MNKQGEGDVHSSLDEALDVERVRHQPVSFRAKASPAVPLVDRAHRPLASRTDFLRPQTPRKLDVRMIASRRGEGVPVKGEGDVPPERGKGDGLIEGEEERRGRREKGGVGQGLEEGRMEKSEEEERGPLRRVSRVWEKTEDRIS